MISYFYTTPAGATISLYQLINAEKYPEQAYYTAQKEDQIHQDMASELNNQIEIKKYNETKLQNELYQPQLSQQEKKLWMMGIVIILLFIALIVLVFYQREKKKRLLSEQSLHKEQIEEKARQLEYENLLLHKEAELSALREKETSLQNKEHELREAIFRRISFFHKLPSLHTDMENSNLPRRKIEVTDKEWEEIRLAVNDGFDNFAIRLQRDYPLLTEKEVCFCCLVKTNVNQGLSDIYCVSKAAITKRKYRIKTEKLGVTDESCSLDQIYNPTGNKLEARFTVKYPQDKIPWYDYSELPNHYLGNVSSPIQIPPNQTVGSKPALYIVDKKSLRGNYFRLYNDFLGTTDMGIWTSSVMDIL